MRIKNRRGFEFQTDLEVENKYRLFAEGDAADDGAGGGSGDADGGEAGEAAADNDAEGGSEKPAANEDSLLSAADKKSDVVDGEKEVKLLAGKFKTADEMEAGYKELTKKLVESGKIAPDSYEIDLPDGLALADPENDPQLKAFNEKAKELNLTNDQYNAVLAMKLQFDAENTPNFEEEFKKLGDNAQEEVGSLVKFLGANYSENAMAQFEKLAMTAEGVRALQEVQKNAKGTVIPGDAAQKQSGKATPEQAEEALQKALAAEKEGKPEASRLRKEAERKFAEAFPDD